jgi:CubicO group peptidase (beta-lactamase class C family)
MPRPRTSFYSLSKSFTSTAVGLAIADGRLSLDDEVLKFFPEDAPAQPSANLQSMRVRDLLRMATGHQTEAQLRSDEAGTKNQAWTKTFLAHPVPCQRSDWDQGYGYQFWRCRHNAYRGDGAFGQYCIVIPELDAVVAITSGVRNMQSVMDLVWEKLLPTMRASPCPKMRLPGAPWRRSSPV